jgi:hypothetical protein
MPRATPRPSRHFTLEVSVIREDTQHGAPHLPPEAAPDSPPSRKGSAELTPFLRQWTAAKRENPDALLFFRMGDFYELFTTTR